MTKNEFKAALKQAGELIDDVSDIFYRITREASLSQDEEDVEDLQDALFDMYPTGWSMPADKIFTEYCDFFEDDNNDTNAEPDLWSQYITYLHEWANDHKNQAFYGCTPACFEEWYDNEYVENNE